MSQATSHDTQELRKESYQVGYSFVNCCSVRSNSARQIQGDFRQHTQKTSERVIEEALKPWGRLDVLVNNVSEFHQTEVGKNCPRRVEWTRGNKPVRFILLVSGELYESLRFFFYFFFSVQERNIILQFSTGKIPLYFLWSSHLFTIFEWRYRGAA